MGTNLRLPNDWEPRRYQLPLWSYLENGGLRAVGVWHRRAGKDDVALHWTAVAANDVGDPRSIGRVGTYWHLLPEANQARKAIWEAVNPHTGKRRIDEAFPIALRDATRENEMFIRFKTGSTWQVVGSDNYDSLVGSPPIGVVFSEWALADPQAWAYLRPILAENGGWALFIYTPRGRNHGATFYDAAKDDKGWFSEILKADTTGVFTKETLDREYREYVREFGQDDGERRFRQEYFCDFNAAVVGAYYGREMQAADEQKRITVVPWEPDRKVHTAWDIGVSDSTAIWFVQLIDRWVNVIDYVENSGVGLDWYAKELKAKPYVYGEHIWPHDGDISEWGSGKTRVQTANALGLNPRIMPQRAKQDSINGARLLIPRCRFDAKKCERGINALRAYRREWDDKRKTFHDRPLHDWASHGSDAYAELAAAEATGSLVTQEMWSKKLDYSKISKGVV